MTDSNFNPYQPLNLANSLLFFKILPRCPSRVSADDHTFVGHGVNPTGDSEAWITTIPDIVPEPSCIVLALFGFAPLVSCGRRRR